MGPRFIGTHIAIGIPCVAALIGNNRITATIRTNAGINSRTRGFNSLGFGGATIITQGCQLRIFVGEIGAWVCNRGQCKIGRI